MSDHDHPQHAAASRDGIDIPDSRMARDLTQFIRDTESELLFHHSTRVYLFRSYREACWYGPNPAAPMTHAFGSDAVPRASMVLRQAR